LLEQVADGAGSAVEVGDAEGLAQLVAGVDVAVRAALRHRAHVSQDVPGGELSQGGAVLGIGDAVQP
jgi:hypothetical protein